MASLTSLGKVGSSRPKTLAAQHDASSSIRAQSKKGGEKGEKNGRKETVKAVLASPLTIPWPNLPRHLQNTVVHALPHLVPPVIAEYHVSRARCHAKEKKGRWKETRKELKTSSNEGSNGGMVEGKGVESNSQLEEAGHQVEGIAGKKRKQLDNPQSEQKTKKTKVEGSNVKSFIKTRPPRPLPKVTERPTPPEILQHLVLGINETIKTLERQIDGLKFRLMIMADALNGTAHVPTKPGVARTVNEDLRKGSNLLPTAPVRSPSPSPSSSSSSPPPSAPEPSDTKSTLSKQFSPLTFIFLPLPDISPQSLVSPIPTYCATYNSLIYQYNQLCKSVKTRVKASEWGEVLGEDMGWGEEVRVVPLGAVELEMAAMVGLRRLACLGIKASHPDIAALHTLLPKSTLHPPRHSITLPLPIPSSSLAICNGSKANLPAKPISTQEVGGKMPTAHIHYAPIHIKGLKISTPIDGAAKKAKRLEEVRAKRRETQEKRRKDRIEALRDEERGDKGRKGKMGKEWRRNGEKTNCKALADQ